MGMVVAEAVEVGREAGVVVVASDVDGPPLAALTWPGVWLVVSQIPAPGVQVETGASVTVGFRDAGGEDAPDRIPVLPAAPDPDGFLASQREDE